MRVVPRANDAINECWISDRDRFSYEGIYSADRLQKPHGARRATAPGSEVRLADRARSRRQGLKAAAAGRLGVLAGASSTVEEYALLQQLAAGLGTSNIDHRLRQVDFSGDAADPALPSLGGAHCRGRHARRRCWWWARTCGASCRCWRIACARPRTRGAKVWFLNPARIRIPVPGGRTARGCAGRAAGGAQRAAVGRGRRRPSAARVARRHRSASRHRRTAARRAVARPSGWARWRCVIRSTPRCARRRRRWPRPRAPRWACWPKAAMPPARIWPACCRIAPPAA